MFFDKIKPMATKQTTIDFLLDQLSECHAPLRTKKMFGEYALYCNEKVVGFVCDDQLFLKPTSVAKELLTQIHEAPPYPGAKMYYRIDTDSWENKQLLADLITQTAQVLPPPKPKKKRV